MTLDNVLKEAPKASQARDHTVLFLHGMIEVDHDSNYFRLYRNPQNRRSYLLVKKEDVAGELHKWSTEEVAHAGLVGTTIHSVPIKLGSQVQGVSVALHRIGESAAGRSKPGKNITSGQVCCCDNCTDVGTCSVTSAENCAQFGVVCPGNC